MNECWTPKKKILLTWKSFSDVFDQEFDFRGHDSAFKDRYLQLQNVRVSFIPTDKSDIHDLGPMEEVNKQKFSSTLYNLVNYLNVDSLVFLSYIYLFCITCHRLKLDFLPTLYYSASVEIQTRFLSFVNLVPSLLISFFVGYSQSGEECVCCTQSSSYNTRRAGGLYLYDIFY